MRCELCRQENPTDARFCGGCGAPLVGTEQESAGRIPPDLLPVVAGEPSFLPVILAEDVHGRREPRTGQHPSRLPWIGLVLLALVLAAGGGYALGQRQAAG